MGFNRREFPVLSLLFCFLAVVQSSTTGSSESVIVTANGEQLRGLVQDNITIFRGIPFAQAPVNELRWQAPHPNRARDGQQNADQFAPACMQTRYNTSWYEDVVKAFDGDIAAAPAPFEISEDCLYLNVWSGDTDSDARLPVMVFLYGGNNRGGWSYEPNYLGHNLAARGVVVVSIAYRLGVFGFLAHPQLTAESGTGSSGNYALLDQIAALQWVQKNIFAFGGDANNVTVFGESAGGANISWLMQSPLASGLFRNAIRQSGAFDLNYRDTLAHEEVFGEEFAASLTAPSVAALRQLPAEKILAAAEEYYFAGGDNQERAQVYGAKDGYVLSSFSEQAYREGKIHPVNVLLGTNADEKLMYTPEFVSQDAIDALVDKYFIPGAKRKVLAQVAELSDNRLKYAELVTAKQQSCTAQRQADSISSNGKSDVYLYLFSRVRPGIGGQRLGAYHGAELPYVFDTHDDWLSGDKVDEDLTQSIMSYWVNFAATGNPNGEGLVKWPRYNSGSRLAIELGGVVREVEAPNRGLCDLLGPPQP